MQPFHFEFRVTIDQWQLTHCTSLMCTYVGRGGLWSLSVFAWQSDQKNESGQSECWSQVHVSTSMMLLICTSVVQPTSSKVFDYYIASLVVKYWWHHSWQKFETSMWRCVNSVYKALVLLPIEGLGTRLELWNVYTMIPWMSTEGLFSCATKVHLC